MKQLVLLCLAVSTLSACNNSANNTSASGSETAAKETPIAFDGGCFVWEKPEDVASSRLVFTIVDEKTAEGSLDLIEGEHVVSGEFKLNRIGNELRGTWTLDGDEDSNYSEELQFKLDGDNIIQNIAALDENGKFPQNSQADYSRIFVPGPCNAKAE